MNELTSVELSNKINDILTNYSDITFIIGGSYGLHDDIKKLSNLSLSFSKLTFPHQLFRVMLLEQIYRTYKINNNDLQFGEMQWNRKWRFCRARLLLWYIRIMKTDMQCSG